jgi:hypothetical protein
MSLTGALKRLWVTIQGIAHRTVSSVDDSVEEMRATGMAPAAIKERIKDELKAGPILRELRQFATATAPGVAYDMVSRFGADTLAQRQKQVDDAVAAILRAPAGTRVASLRRSGQDAVDEALGGGSPVVDAWADGDPSAVPPDADKYDPYMWVTMEDGRVCPWCVGNHGIIMAMIEWEKQGAPRAGGPCYAGIACRCELVYTGSMTDDEIDAIRKHGPISPKAEPPDEK